MGLEEPSGQSQPLDYATRYGSVQRDKLYPDYSDPAFERIAAGSHRRGIANHYLEPMIILVHQA